MALLDDIKVNLRVVSQNFDAAEIQPIIDACKVDLRLAGVNVIEDDDPLIFRAIVLYAKAHFGYSEGAERYQRAYDSLKNALALSGDYNAPEAT